MTDDIVTRLRSTFHTGGALIGPEAADEIERLRLDIKDLQKIIQLLKEADDD